MRSMMWVRVLRAALPFTYEATTTSGPTALAGLPRYLELARIIWLREFVEAELPGGEQGCAPTDCVVGPDHVAGGHGVPSVARSAAGRITAAGLPVAGTARGRGLSRIPAPTGPSRHADPGPPRRTAQNLGRSPPLRSTRLSPGPPFLRRRASAPRDRQQPDHLRSARPGAVTAHRSAWHL